MPRALTTELRRALFRLSDAGQPPAAITRAPGLARSTPARLLARRAGPHNHFNRVPVGHDQQAPRRLSARWGRPPRPRA